MGPARSVRRPGGGRGGPKAGQTVEKIRQLKPELYMITGGGANTLIRVTPEFVSILDYGKGFGHTDLVRVSESDLEEFVESRRHHWAWHPVD